MSRPLRRISRGGGKKLERGDRKMKLATYKRFESRQISPAKAVRKEATGKQQEDNRQREHSLRIINTFSHQLSAIAIRQNYLIMRLHRSDNCSHSLDAEPCGEPSMQADAHLQKHPGYKARRCIMMSTSRNVIDPLGTSVGFSHFSGQQQKRYVGEKFVKLAH